MAQLREIKNRIKAVANIQRITRTMQMIATAKFQASVKRAEATKPYTAKLAEIVGELASAADAGEHPLLAPPAERTGRERMLVLTSNRGLCGAYNANVLRTAAGFIRDHGDTTFDLEAVGKKAIAYFRFADMAVSRSYTHFTDKAAYGEVEELASDYIDRFIAGEFDAVRVCYMRFESSSRQTPHILQLLPMEPPRAEGGADAEPSVRPVYEFSPDPQTLLGELLPLAVKARLFQCFNDAIVSEQIARMVAMGAATDNAGKMSRNLKREFNRARQAQITTELSEIIGGAAALG